MRLEDYIDSDLNEEAPLPNEGDEDAKDGVDKASADGETSPESLDAKDTDKDKEPEAGEAEKPLDASYDDAIAFHQKFIAVDEEDPTTIASFAKEMADTSPLAYGKFVEMIVAHYAPQYGFTKPEAEADDDFDDDGLTTDREKTLAEENEALRAQLAERQAQNQHTIAHEREEAFLEAVGETLESLVGALQLHPELGPDVLREVAAAVSATEEFQAALKSAMKDEGKRSKTLMAEAQRVAAEVVATNVPKYTKRSNALKVYDQNLAPKEQRSAPKLDTVPVAQIQTEISDKRPLPPRGSPLSAYV